MAEQLASLRKKGGGGGASGINLASTLPDVSYTQTSFAANATQNITVTQMPRFIVLSLWGASNTYPLINGIIDVENDVAIRRGAWSTGTPAPMKSAESWSYSGYITTITASTVTVKNNLGVSARMVCDIYY